MIQPVRTGCLATATAGMAAAAGVVAGVVVATGVAVALGVAAVGDGAGSTAGTPAVRTVSVPSTPGAAPGGAGGTAAGAGGVAGVGGGSAIAAAGAESARAGSAARGRPAKGNGAADAVWTPLGLTLRVFTSTGRIGSVEPGTAAAAVAGSSSSAAAALARLKRWASFCAPAADAVRWADLGSAFGAASAISGAVRLVEALVRWALSNWCMRASRLDALDPPSTTA